MTHRSQLVAHVTKIFGELDPNPSNTWAGDHLTMRCRYNGWNFTVTSHYDTDTVEMQLDNPNDVIFQGEMSHASALVEFGSLMQSMLKGPKFDTKQNWDAGEKDADDHPCIIRNGHHVYKYYHPVDNYLKCIHCQRVDQTGDETWDDQCPGYQPQHNDSDDDIPF
jgi:hypothetical protein